MTLLISWPLLKKYLIVWSIWRWKYLIGWPLLKNGIPYLTLGVSCWLASKKMEFHHWLTSLKMGMSHWFTSRKMGVSCRSKIMDKGGYRWMGNCMIAYRDTLIIKGESEGQSNWTWIRPCLSQLWQGRRQQQQALLQPVLLGFTLEPVELHLISPIIFQWRQHHSWMSWIIFQRRQHNWNILKYCLIFWIIFLPWQQNLSLTSFPISPLITSKVPTCMLGPDKAWRCLDFEHWYS